MYSHAKPKLVTIRGSSSFVGKGIYETEIITKLFYAKK